MNKTNNLQNDFLAYEQQKIDRYISVDERIYNLKKLFKLIKDNENSLLDSLLKDLNKSNFEALNSEFYLFYKEIKLVIKKLKKWTKHQHVKTPIHLFYSKSSIFYEALGQVLIVSPWNYPILLTLMPLIYSIAAGNRTILKTSELSIHTTNRLKELINSNFSNDYIYVMDENVESIKRILKEKFDFIFFTGSYSTGLHISKAAAEFNTPVVLELGGKSPTIIDKDFNLDEAVQRIMFGKIMNAGQTCVAPDYVCVHESQIKKFIQLANNYVKQRLTNLNNYPKIINSKHYERLSEFITNKELLINNTNQIIPHILESNFQDKIMQDEIFGPILPIISYKTIDELLEKIKKLPKPLVSYVFSKNKEFINTVKINLSSGNLAINDTLVQLSNNYLPFGGVGQSGHGKYHGFEGFKLFSNAKSVFHRKHFATNLASHPYTDKKAKFLKRIFKTK